MQRVLLVGSSEYNFDLINKALYDFGPKIINHKNILAKLTSIWRPDHTEENAIRYSGVAEHIVLSFLIATTQRKMINIIQYVRFEQINIDDDSFMLGLCTGNLIEWRDLIFKCLKSVSYLNDLGQVLLKELDTLGYGGLFANYARRQDGNILRLESRL